MAQRAELDVRNRQLLLPLKNATENARPAVQHIIDYWHEMDWWWDEVFGPLDRDHKRLGKAIEAAQAALEKLHGEDRVKARHARARLERQRQRVEREFYLACEAEEQVRALYDPLDPDGGLWTDARVNAVLEALKRRLLRIIAATNRDWKRRPRSGGSMPASTSG